MSHYKKSHSMANQNAAMKLKDQHSVVAYDSTALVWPVYGATWRGRFSIPVLNIDINIAARISKNACLEVLEVARVMPASLLLEMIPRLDAWPASFESSPPTEHSVSLFFFPEGRDEEVLDNLLTRAICTEFALKSMIGETELLIFTSLQLPRNLHRIQGKPYFWGVFREQQVATSNQSDYHAYVQNNRVSLSPNSGNHRSSKRRGSPVTISSDNSSSTQTSKADGRGRRLDTAWDHAKPLDVSRQKAECRYCGFISLHGGISRLKAHLGGGVPRIRLPGCDKVSPEVKKVMAEWFGEWLKNTKSLWAKEIKAASAGYVTQEYAKPLNAACKRKNGEYSGESTRDGIPLHNVNFGGGYPMHVEAQSKVSRSEWVKNLSESMEEKSIETRGRRLDDAWKHATSLDELRQKTRCNYCGFVSSYGGISRLKAHLGGGCAQVQLPGCPQVSLDIKRVMEQWFNEWAKNSSASWIGKSLGASPRPPKRKKTLDDTWEHAILLDETGEATKCKYCGFVSKFGGIPRLKAHFSGGDPVTQLQGCPNVSPEFKSSMAGGKKKHSKKSKRVSTVSLGSMLQGKGTLMEAESFEKQHHILPETLDEISNTSLKGRLQRLIDEKNAELRKMQAEVQSLVMQLSSIP